MPASLRVRKNSGLSLTIFIRGVYLRHDLKFRLFLVGKARFEVIKILFFQVLGMLKCQVNVRLWVYILIQMIKGRVLVRKTDQEYSKYADLRIRFFSIQPPEIVRSQGIIYFIPYVTAHE